MNLIRNNSDSFNFKGHMNMKNSVEKVSQIMKLKD